MTQAELATVMEIVSKELKQIQGGVRGMSNDEFRRTINRPWNKIREEIITQLGVKDESDPDSNG